MTIVGVISDIHSNSDALQAVVDDMKKRGVEVILCTGDIIGYHSHPNETVQILRDERVISIQGNHDADILAKRFNPARNPDILEFTYNLLTDDSKKWLAALPQSQEITLESVSILLSHGSPEDIEEYLHQSSDEAENYANLCDSDVLLSGHTHIPWVHQFDETLFVNSGSVGKPKQGKPVATWAQLTVDGTVAAAEIREVEYDNSRIVSATKDAGFTRYAEALRTGIVS